MKSLEFWQVIVPVVVAILAWLLNESSKRSWEQYKRKEERYKELLLSLRGYYVASQDLDKRQQFLDQVNLCWLYSPDIVIRKANAFLNTVKTGTQATDADRVRAAGELFVTIRNDLLPRRILRFWRKTQLDVQDVRHLYIAGR
jgi:hypothetical protein